MKKIIFIFMWGFLTINQLSFADELKQKTPSESLDSDESTCISEKLKVLKKLDPNNNKYGIASYDLVVTSTINQKTQTILSVVKFAEDTDENKVLKKLEDFYNNKLEFTVTIDLSKVTTVKPNGSRIDTCKEIYGWIKKSEGGLSPEISPNAIIEIRNIE